jgi:[ribosomal protein S5]-alanine N-acetyltransferase
MQLETERLLIRDFTEADFAAVYAYGSDPEVVRYMVFPPSTPESTREHIARCMGLASEQPRRCYDMGVVLKSTGQLIGGITLGVLEGSEDEAAFSYLLNRTVWGQGYATEALKAMVRFGFEQLALRRIADSCAVENSASARVMEKCGFRCISEREGERFYALTADEWQQIVQTEAPRQHLTTFTTYKRWDLRDGRDESDLINIVSNHIIPHYRQLDPVVRLELLRILGTRSFLALQHWPSRSHREVVLSSDRYKSWYQEYEPILEQWNQLMAFVAEWETEDVL